MKEYAIGSFVKVRKLAGVYKVIDSWSVNGRIPGRRRYKLIPAKGSGALLEVTEAFGDDMDSSQFLEDPRQPTSAYEPVAIQEPEPAGTGPQEAARPASDGTGPAPRCKRKPLRFSPGEFVEGSILKDVVFSTRIIGFEDYDAEVPPAETMPIAASVTTEINGYAVWVITDGPGSPRVKAWMESFYLIDSEAESKAIEHAVMIAVRSAPIRAGDLQISLLSTETK